MSATNSITGHHGDYRFGAGSDLTLKLQDIQALHTFGGLISRITADSLISAGTESCVPLTGNDNHTCYIQAAFQNVHCGRCREL